MGGFDAIGDFASSAFDSISSTVSGASNAVSSAFDGWFGDRGASPAPHGAPAPSPAEPSLWDRIGLTMGDLGRGLSEEGIGGLLNPGEVIDRQEARRNPSRRRPLFPKTSAVTPESLWPSGQAPAHESLLAAPKTATTPEPLAVPVWHRRTSLCSRLRKPRRNQSL